MCERAYRACVVVYEVYCPGDEYDIVVIVVHLAFAANMHDEFCRIVFSLDAVFVWCCRSPS